MKHGLNSLASVAATAPLVGFFGTVFGAIGSFRGLGTERSTGMIWTAKYLSASLVPTALGLLVGVLAFFCYKYLVVRLENFDIEMKNASLELIDALALL
jgi:biopolymer transport protein ExbB/TolQ